MRRIISGKALAFGTVLTLAAGPGAFAQMSPDSDYGANGGNTAGERADDAGGAGSTQNQEPTQPRQRGQARATGGGQGYTVPPELRDDVQPRMGAAQRELELVQTTLLNRFGSLGFAQMREFRRDGERYVAEVMNPNGAWETVVIDPVSGEVTTRQ